MITALKSRLLVLRFKRLMSPDGWASLIAGLIVAGVSGVIRGIGLVMVLPALTALMTGDAVWGLTITGWLIALAIVGILGAICEYFLAMRAFSAALDLLLHLHITLGDKIANIPMGWFTGDSAGVFSRLVSKEMMMLGESLAHMALPMLQNAMAILTMVIGAFIWSWPLGLVLLIAIPILAVLLTASQAFMVKAKTISEPPEQDLAARLVEYATAQGTIRACGLGTDYPQLHDAIASSHKASEKSHWYQTIGLMLSGSFTQVIVVAMIVVAAWLVSLDALGPIEAIVFMGICLKFYDTLATIIENVMGFEDRREVVVLAERALDAPLLPEVAKSSERTTVGDIELRDVHFGYLQHEPVLNGVSITIPAKSMCAIVGPSGSGKTTIARLISRFYDVDAGAIKVSGVDVRDLTIEDLMQDLSMVFQDVYLFDDTLEANIRIGREGASDEDVLWAARLAGVDEIVARLPHGYQTRVGEGGRSLSGGERQRVSVARALLKKAPIVLLDEATSALDAENEANIVASMEALRQQSTLVVIAHKLDTIRSADQVVVLSNDGKVAQVGTHTQLLAETGPYQQFWKSREEAEGWKLV